MRFVLCALEVVLGLSAAHADDTAKTDPGRVKGMRAAIADIEKGTLKLVTPPTPAPAWEAEYHRLF